MKKRIFIFFITIISLLSTSCESELKPKKIIGSWKQIAVKSQIGDEEPEIITEESVWTFNADSTCSIKVDDEIDTGTWTLADDSSLVVFIDSIATSFKIILCDNDTLVQKEIVETDFGQITEITTLIKE